MAGAAHTNGNGNGGITRLSLYVTAAGVMFAVLVSGVGAISWLTSLSGRLGSVETTAASNATKIVEIYKRQDQRNEEVQDIRERLTRIETTLTEIETQFCGQRDSSNLMHAFDVRMIALLWQKGFTAPFPTEPTYLPQCMKQR